MLKIFEREVGRGLTFAKRVVNMRSRYAAIPKTEASGIKIVDRDHEEDTLLRNDLESMTSVDATKYFVDYKRSRGNYFQDVDGNTILDLTSGGGSLALGYNHPDLVKAINSPQYDAFVNQEVSLTQTPPQQYNELVKSTLLPFAPEGLNKVHLVDDVTGTVANEYALRAAFMSHHEKVTGQTGYSPKELQSSQANAGSKYTAVAFAGANHGTSLATLSLSSHPQKFNLPTLPFEIIDFPSNQSDEGRVLENFSAFLKEN